jgi:hypothetical protein
VKAACDELGITLIAYSPIAQGRPSFILYTLFLLLYYYSSRLTVSELIGILSGC